MKIAVLGATGQTGQFLVKQALQQGHVVTAIVRDPGKLVTPHGNLKVVEANIFSKESLQSHFQEQDAVISCLGFPPAWFSAVTGYTSSIEAIVPAMREAQVTRLIAMTSWYTQPKSAEKSPFLVRYLLLPIIGRVLSNMYDMETFLNQTEDINWTVVRPPGLRNEPATAKEFLTHEDYFVPDASGHPVGNSVARGDVARFMLSLLSSNAWFRRGVAVTTK